MENKLVVIKNIILNIEKVIVGKRQAIELCLMTFLCKGHILIEDVPGVGKTSLASALAKSLNCSFKRIQFTPDIMPSDITGFSVYNPKTGKMEYNTGAILHQVILADEINRTSPKTQSSLLEAMEERQVTVDGHTYQIDEPFIVIATQNPIEYLGTYPLPEAQMDRFFMRISLGYPARADEMKMISRFKGESPWADIKMVASGEDILEIQKLVTEVYVSTQINEYIVNLVRSTREHELVALGASPRASIHLCKASQAWAFYCGRTFVLPDDVIKMIHHVLEHRIIIKQEGKMKKITAYDVIEDILQKTAVPVV